MRILNIKEQTAYVAMCGLKRKKGFYSISAVAEMFSVHQQTIRLYEKQGLITPKRSEGNTRLFSEEDINRLEEIIYYTHKLGINLAGVEMILKLQKQVKKLQKEMNTLFKKTQDELERQTLEHTEAIRASTEHLHALAQLPRKRGKSSVKELPAHHTVSEDKS